ncbi:unnamed protein product [Gongylonema pulchrum]|uniref:PLAT domain-containing protein n=1 Tax=Gongylonema pulchrum TaxID=637853 RepID=A0A183EJK5_9BILA|nr:unnamed protein product [Gongylonema pulchrum]
MTLFSTGYHSDQFHFNKFCSSFILQLTDVDGRKTDKVRLKCSVTHRKKFQRGHSDLFLLIEQAPLEDLTSIEVWHEKKGDNKPWLLKAVYVIEHIHHTLYQFPCNEWLGEDPEFRQSSIKLDVAGKPFKVLQEDEI